MNDDQFKQREFMLSNSDIPIFPMELFQKDRKTFEDQFNSHSSSYLWRLFIEYPNLFLDFILKAVEYDFIDLMDAEGHSTHFNLTIDGVSLNYGFIRLNGGIYVYQKTDEDPHSTAIIKLPIPLEGFAAAIVSNLSTSSKVEMKFITPE
ncbi:MAG: hypothetical protein ACMG57_04220 [Candidatus Dojkabacteria bacterium]